jgi:hypothetical protein
MAWQDFCHFPSYEIPACLYRLRDHLEFVEAVVPGTTLVFRREVADPVAGGHAGSAGAQQLDAGRDCQGLVVLDGLRSSIEAGFVRLRGVDVPL